jgi:pyruvate carboxylase
MTTQNLTVNELVAKADTLSFPDSTMAFFRGELGQPHGGFNPTLQAAVLKGEKPFTDRPNAHLAPIDFEVELKEFHQAFGVHYTELDFLSYKLYPKVFKEYVAFRQQFGSMTHLPTLQWFFGLKPEEEAMIDIAPGKSIIVKYLYNIGPDADGKRRVYFELNGQTRTVEVLDKNVKDLRPRNPKADATDPKQIAAPLQGKLARVLVEIGDAIEKNQPLFVIEAMKMESNVVAPQAGTVSNITLAGGELVEAGDLVVTLV